MLGGLGGKGEWRDRGGRNFWQFDLWGESYLVCYWNFKLTGVIYEQIYICSRYLKYLPWSWILLQFVSTHRPPAHYFITYAVQVNFFTNICVSLLQKALTGFVHVLSQADLFLVEWLTVYIVYIKHLWLFVCNYIYNEGKQGNVFTWLFCFFIISWS